LRRASRIKHKLPGCAPAGDPALTNETRGTVETKGGRVEFDRS
jgi:hypothetical protein